MRVLDIAAASSFALLSLSLIAVMNPLTLRAEADRYRANAIANSELLSFLSRTSLHFLTTSDQGVVCSSLSAHGNSTEAVDVLVNGVGCMPNVPDNNYYSGRSEAEIRLPGRMVQVKVWVKGVR